jgi:hypothetical protein
VSGSNLVMTLRNPYQTAMGTLRLHR